MSQNKFILCEDCTHWQNEQFGYGNCFYHYINRHIIVEDENQEPIVHGGFVFKHDYGCIYAEKKEIKNETN